MTERPDSRARRTHAARGGGGPGRSRGGRGSGAPDRARWRAHDSAARSGSRARPAGALATRLTPPDRPRPPPQTPTTVTIRSSPAKSAGFRVYSARPFAAATDLSSRPREGSGIHGLVGRRVQIGSQSVGVHTGRMFGRHRQHRARNESARRNRPQLSDRYPVTRHDESLPRLHLPQDGAGIVAQLSLSDCSLHREQCSTRSTS